MIRMVDIEGPVPESMCILDDQGNAISFKGCPGCFEWHERNNKIIGCENGSCDIDKIFKEYVELSGKYKNMNREEKKMNNLLSGIFGKMEPGMCRLSMSGNIAVNTTNGYKSYNLKTGRLTNCDSFVFDIGEEFFFVIPTNKAKIGDIILVSRKPKCVINAEKNILTVINYEDSTVEKILPERHVFMGNTYFYGKIVSMFGSNMIKGKKGTNMIMQYMIMSEMLKGNAIRNEESSSGMGAMIPFLMMGGNTGNMFDELFDFNDEEEVNEESEEIEEILYGIQEKDF